jgi:hypothetical protein
MRPSNPGYGFDAELEDWHRWWNDRGSWELRELLMTEWDPIHVRNAQGAQDEYDGYLGQLGGLLRKGASATGVAEYLAWAEGRMGFDTQPEDLAGVAEKVTRWYSAAT